MSKNHLSGSSHNFRVNPEDSLNCFSNEMEYMRYLHDFYNRVWSSVPAEISDSKRDAEIDMAYADYYSSSQEDSDDEASVIECIDCAFDEEVEKEDEEKVYGKNRFQRSMKRKREWHNKFHNRETASILTNKALKESQDAHEVLLRKSFFRKSLEMDKRCKFFSSKVSSDSDTTHKPSDKKTVLSSSTKVKSKKDNFINRTSMISSREAIPSVKKSNMKKTNKSRRGKNLFAVKMHSVDLMPFSYRYCSGIGLYF